MGIGEVVKRFSRRLLSARFSRLFGREKIADINKLNLRDVGEQKIVVIKEGKNGEGEKEEQPYELLLKKEGDNFVKISSVREEKELLKLFLEREEKGVKIGQDGHAINGFGKNMFFDKGETCEVNYQGKRVEVQLKHKIIRNEKLSGETQFVAYAYGQQLGRGADVSAFSLKVKGILSLSKGGVYTYKKYKKVEGQDNKQIPSPFPFVYKAKNLLGTMQKLSLSKAELAELDCWNEYISSTSKFMIGNAGREDLDFPLGRMFCNKMGNQVFWFEPNCGKSIEDYIKAEVLEKSGWERALLCLKMSNASSFLYAYFPFHGDLKLENMLIDESGKVTIIDFPDLKDGVGRKDNIAHTLGYTAPEIQLRDEELNDLKKLELLLVEGKQEQDEENKRQQLKIERNIAVLWRGIEKCDESADVFTLGVNFIRVFFAEKWMEYIEEGNIWHEEDGLMSDGSRGHAWFSIKVDLQKELNENPNCKDAEFKKLIVSMLDFEPEKRPIFSDVAAKLQNYLLKTGDANQKNILYGYHKSCTERYITAAEILVGDNKKVVDKIFEITKEQREGADDEKKKSELEKLLQGNIASIDKLAKIAESALAASTEVNNKQPVNNAVVSRINGIKGIKNKMKEYLLKKLPGENKTLRELIKDEKLSKKVLDLCGLLGAEKLKPTNYLADEINNRLELNIDKKDKDQWAQFYKKVFKIKQDILRGRLGKIFAVILQNKELKHRRGGGSQLWLGNLFRYKSIQGEVAKIKGLYDELFQLFLKEPKAKQNADEIVDKILKTFSDIGIDFDDKELELEIEKYFDEQKVEKQEGDNVLHRAARMLVDIIKGDKDEEKQLEAIKLMTLLLRNEEMVKKLGSVENQKEETPLRILINEVDQENQANKLFLYMKGILEGVSGLRVEEKLVKEVSVEKEGILSEDEQEAEQRLSDFDRASKNFAIEILRDMINANIGKPLDVNEVAVAISNKAKELLEELKNQKEKSTDKKILKQVAIWQERISKFVGSKNILIKDNRAFEGQQSLSDKFKEEQNLEKILRELLLRYHRAAEFILKHMGYKDFGWKMEHTEAAWGRTFDILKDKVGEKKAYKQCLSGLAAELVEAKVFASGKQEQKPNLKEASKDLELAMSLLSWQEAPPVMYTVSNDADQCFIQESVCGAGFTVEQILEWLKIFDEKPPEWFNRLPFFAKEYLKNDNKLNLKGFYLKFDLALKTEQAKRPTVAKEVLAKEIAKQMQEEFNQLSLVNSKPSISRGKWPGITNPAEKASVVLQKSKKERDIYDDISIFRTIQSGTPANDNKKLSREEQERLTFQNLQQLRNFVEENHNLYGEDIYFVRLETFTKSEKLLGVKKLLSFERSLLKMVEVAVSKLPGKESRKIHYFYRPLNIFRKRLLSLFFLDTKEINKANSSSFKSGVDKLVRDLTKKIKSDEDERYAPLVSVFSKHAFSKTDLGNINTELDKLPKVQPLDQNLIRRLYAVRDLLYIQLNPSKINTDSGNIHRAALEVIAFNAVFGCKSGNDRTGVLGVYVNAMLAYFAKHKKFPEIKNAEFKKLVTHFYLSGDVREFIGKVFPGQMVKHPQHLLPKKIFGFLIKLLSKRALAKDESTLSRLNHPKFDELPNKQKMELKNIIEVKEDELIEQRLQALGKGSESPVEEEKRTFWVRLWDTLKSTWKEFVAGFQPTKERVEEEIPKGKIKLEKFPVKEPYKKEEVIKIEEMTEVDRSRMGFRTAEEIAKEMESAKAAGAEVKLHVAAAPLPSLMEESVREGHIPQKKIAAAVPVKKLESIEQEMSRLESVFRVFCEQRGNSSCERLPASEGNGFVLTTYNAAHEEGRRLTVKRQPDGTTLYTAPDSSLEKGFEEIAKLLAYEYTHTEGKSLDKIVVYDVQPPDNEKAKKMCEEALRRAGFNKEIKFDIGAAPMPAAPAAAMS